MSAKTRSRFTTAAVLVVASLILYVFFLLVKTDLYVLIVDWANRERFLATGTSLITVIPLILFVLLMCVFWVKRLLVPQEAQSESATENVPTFRPRFIILAWFAGFITIMGLSSGISIYTNPRNMYGTRFFAPWVVPGHEVKINYYAALDNTPDVVIFGSSRAFAFSPAYITEKLGYTAFNMSFPSGKINDFSVYTRFMLTQHDHRLPKVILMEIDYPIPLEEDFSAAATPLSLLPFMDDYTRQKAIQARVDGLWAVDQLAEALYVMRFTSVYGQFKGSYDVHPDGWTTDRTEYTPELLESKLATEISLISPLCGMQTIPEGETMLRDYIEMARTYGSTVILLRNPYNPLYYEAMKERMADFDQCESIQHDFFDSLTREYDNVMFADYKRPDSFPGGETADGFYGRYHMSNEKATLLLDALLPTIQQGYQRALQNSVGNS